MRSHPVAALISLSLLAGRAGAQTGTPDQVSPRSGASYNLNESFLLWQQQVRAGVAGQLEGVLITLLGPVGAQADVRIRLGDAPSSQPESFAIHLTKAIEGQEDFFVNMTAANIVLAAGATFVIETQGNNTGANLLGNYVDPAAGPPLYPEPLFLMGSIFVPGWRHGFTTYMLGGAAPCYANCDASTTPPVLNVLDFTCFLNRFAAADTYANCDHSTTPPTLNVLDFTCFLNSFAAGCT
jgi:hypothetical protein